MCACRQVGIIFALNDAIKEPMMTRDLCLLVVIRLCEEVGGLFLQASPCAGIRAVPAGARDSGYDSLRRRLSILDRLAQTHAVWLQLGLGYRDATHILQSQPTGVSTPTATVASCTQH